MKQEDYQKLADDVFGLIDTDALLKALEPTKPFREGRWCPRHHKNGYNRIFYWEI